MKINWREKFIAVAIHFLVTLLLAAAAAGVIFLIWFPGELANMVGGGKLFLLVVACDVTLGPLLSLVIYNSRKSTRELLLDYSLIALVQLSALIYGVMTVAASRPVFVVFAGDRLEIVTAIEFDDADLAAGREAVYRTKSWWGPRLVSIEWPTDPAERSNLALAAIGGKDVQFFPKYYQDYGKALPTIAKRSRAMDELLGNSGAARAILERAIAKTREPREQLRWLLAHHRFGFGTAFIDAKSGEPVGYAAVDPVWLDEMPSAKPHAGPSPKS